MRRLWGWLRGPAVLVGALGLAGCPGSLEDKERFLDGGLACGDVPARLLAPSCGGSGCHGATAPQQGLDLESPGVAGRLFGVRGKTCVGLLADAANPENSLVYSKLLASPTCGARMPLARAPLADADIECVRQWLAAQAPSGDGGSR